MAALAATACRLGSGRVARVALTRVARPTTATHVAHRNMAGGPEFARMHINKNYWVEQYNDLRENQFKTWTMNKKNALPLVWMVLIIPVTVYFLAKNELQHNAEHNGRANKPAGYKMM